MALVVLDRDQQNELIRQRRESGADHHDEVWDGVYVMSPNADNEHFDLAGDFLFVVKSALPDRKQVRVSSGVNVSDRQKNWTKNFRCPDLAIFFPENPAKDMGTYWFGGPDFALEVISPHDRSRKKLAFYAKIGVRELLLLDRDPWSLELYRLTDGELKLIGESTSARPVILTSQVLPITFTLVPDEPRPTIQVTQANDGRQWTI